MKSVSILFTEEQQEYLRRMKINHKIQMSVYIRSLLAKEMEGFTSVPDLLAKYRLPAPVWEPPDTIETGVIVGNRRKKVYVVHEEQIKDVEAQVNIMDELKQALAGRRIEDE